MNFNKAFKIFKDKYISTPRVVKIIENDFGGDDITVLYYDKHDKSSPLTISSWEGYPVDYRGMIELRDMWEHIFDMHVLNDPNSWEQEVPMSYHYKSIAKEIADYELRK